MTETKEAIELLESILKPLRACEPQCKLNINVSKLEEVIALLRTAQEPKCKTCGGLKKSLEYAKACPECGCEEIVNEGLLGEKSRQCAKCGQDWWLDVKYAIGLESCTDCPPQKQPDICSHCDKEIDTSSEGILTDGGELLCMECQEPTEQPNCEGCEFFKHNNKYEHCWRYTQLTSVCKLRQDKEQPPANELTTWLRKTISGDRYEKGDPELQAKVFEACNRLDKAEADIKSQKGHIVQLKARSKERDIYVVEIGKMQDKIEQLEAKLEAKDELLFAYESVNAPVNPLLAINKDLRTACETLLREAFRETDRLTWAAGIVKQAEVAITKAKQS